MKIVTDHGWPKASDGTEPWAFDAFKNERDYLAQGSHSRTTVAAMDWAAREIERLRAALEPFAKHAHATEHIVPNTLRTWCENAKVALYGVEHNADKP